MEFDNEVKKLEEIKSTYKDLTHEYEIKIQNAIKEHKKNPLLYSSLIDQYNNKLAMLKKTINNPFFGRIDFQNNNDENLICYISKVGVLDEDGNAITVDWRAPISTLYYDSDVGKAQFTSPAGLEKGILNLKRQYSIENGKLINFQDVNTISNDELLKPFLENNIDKRLKNIVSTIQGEQNAIIRKPLNENNIIQGAAGSGKTTVALHRIAYLVYNEQKKYNEDAFLVIGPNSYFMKYISSVLPDLDVFNVSQYTFLDIVNNYLKEKINIIDQSEVLENVLEGMDISIIKFKSSLLYKDIVDEYINDFEESIVHGPIKLMNYTLFKEDVIEKFINKKSLSIVERINEFITCGQPVGHLLHADEEFHVELLVGQLLGARHGPESVGQVVVLDARMRLYGVVTAVVVGQQQSFGRDQLARAAAVEQHHGVFHRSLVDRIDVFGREAEAFCAHVVDALRNQAREPHALVGESRECEKCAE